MKCQELNEKFPIYGKLFVRPLYKKKICSEKVSRVHLMFENSKSKHVGRGQTITFDRKFNVSDVSESKHLDTEHYLVESRNNILPGACEPVEIKTCENVIAKDFDARSLTLLDPKVGYTSVRVIEENRTDRSIEIEGKLKTVSDNIIRMDNGTSSTKSGDAAKYDLKERWLRMLPAAELAGEPRYAVLLRCLCCQLGLAVFLVIWTAIGATMIYFSEGPHEQDVTREFTKNQNRLIIDLATELRQITPVSPAWRGVIERRLEDERALTAAALGRGARLEPGRYWDYPGALLFSVYAMTALGFGAPVPQTAAGRSAAILYAAVAVPTHFFLVMNVSTAIVYTVGCWVTRRRRILRRRQAELEKHIQDNYKKAPKDVSNDLTHENIPKGPTAVKIKLKRWLLNLLCWERGVPLALTVYYSLGALSFGVLRDKGTMDTLFFPLQFTTSGGLENVDGRVRVFYSAYVIGAVVLVACALAVLRSKSGANWQELMEKYHLYSTVPDAEDEAHSDN